MPIPTTTQAPSPCWEIDVMYPSPRGDVTASYGLLTGAAETVGENRNMETTANWPATSHVHASAAGGFSNFDTVWNAIESGVAHYSKGGTATYTRDMLAGLRAPIPVNPNNVFADNVELPSVCRVWILSAVLKCLPNPSVGNNLTGLLVQPDPTGGVQGWPTNAVGATNRGGFGIFADGAGQWRFASYNRAGVSLLRTSQALPAHTFENWNRVDFQIIAARPGFPATLELWWNGVLIATYNWTGADLELPAGQEWCWSPGVGAGPALTSAFILRMRRGRFTLQGVEITG